GSQRFSHCCEVAHVDEIRLEPPAKKNLLKQASRPIISIDVRKDVIAGRERLKDRRRRGHAGSEGGGRGAPFSRANAHLERIAVRIVVASVHEAARVGYFKVAFERGREEDRGGDGGGCRV